MNWGKWIVISFIAFAGFITTLVIICVKQDISLVSGNYYQEELDYQKQVDRLSNTAKLEEKPSVELSGDSLKVTYVHFGDVESAQLTLFRPSDEKSDQRFSILPGEQPFRQFDLKSAPPGLYKVRLHWTMSGKEYFTENTIYR